MVQGYRSHVAGNQMENDMDTGVIQTYYAAQRTYNCLSGFGGLEDTIASEFRDLGLKFAYRLLHLKVFGVNGLPLRDENLEV